jgi:hypothetical protein
MIVKGKREKELNVGTRPCPDCRYIDPPLSNGMPLGARTQVLPHHSAGILSALALMPFISFAAFALNASVLNV